MFDRTVQRPRRFRRLLPAALASVLLPLRVQAQSDTASVDPHAVQPERPTAATHAGTVAPGFLEIETGVTVERPGGGLSVLTTPTLFKFGMGSHLQFDLAGSYGRISGGSITSSGFSEPSIGFKWRLLDNHPMFGRFAIQPMLKPDLSGTFSLSSGTTDASVLFISSHSLGSVAMDLNLGITRSFADNSALEGTSTFWTASFGFPIEGITSAVVEVYGFPGTSGSSGSAPAAYILAGPMFTVQKALALDVGIIKSFVGPSTTMGYVGATINIGKVY